jgi:hypothetical protein
VLGRYESPVSIKAPSLAHPFDAREEDGASHVPDRQDKSRQR